jgi:hypothetical protein
MCAADVVCSSLGLNELINSDKDHFNSPVEAAIFRTLFASLSMLNT